MIRAVAPRLRVKLSPEGQATYDRLLWQYTRSPRILYPRMSGAEQARERRTMTATKRYERKAKKRGTR